MATSHPRDLDRLRARMRTDGVPVRPARGEAQHMGFFEGILREVSLPVAVWQDGRHVFANRPYLALLELGPDASIAGLPVREVLVEEAWPQVESALRTLGAGRAVRLDTRGRSQSGTPLELHLSVRALQQGHTVYQVVTAQDLRVLRQAERAFRRNEEGWKHLFSTSMLGLAWLDPDRRIREANEALARLTGRSAEALAGLDWSSLFHQTVEVLPPSEPSRSDRQRVLQIHREDGQAIRVRIDSNPIYQADGSLQGYLAMVQDESRLQAHEAKEALLLQAVEQSPSSIVITDLDGNIEYVNAAFQRVTGFAPSEVLGRNPRILNSGLHSKAFFQELWQTLLQGEEWVGRLCNRKKDGSLFWEQASIAPVSEEGQLRHFLAVKQDITEVVALDASRRKLAAAIEESSEAICLASVDGRVTYANASFQALFPKLHPLPGASLLQVLPSRIRLQTFREIRRTLAFGQPWKGKLTIPGPASGEQVIEGSLAQVEEPEGGSGFIVGVFKDVTLALQSERRLVQFEKLNTLGALANGVAHDLNNVLSAILSATELLEWDLPEGSPSLSRLQVIRQAALRATEINRQIKSFSRKRDEPFTPFDLSALVKEVCSLLRTSLPETIRLSTAVTPGIWVEGDPSQIHQVIMNLAVNAYQAMEPQGGTLEISLEEEAEASSRPELGATHQGSVRLQVRDTGPGIPPEVLPRIFDPYFTTKGSQGGTGVGLAVAQKIITTHHGLLQVSSTLGQGALAEVHLPTVARPAQAPATPHAADHRGIERVMLICGDEVQLALHKQGLERLGYEITTASDGAQGLQKVLEAPHAFEVVVVEEGVRGLSAPSLIQRLRASHPAIGLVFVAHRFDLEEAHHAIPADAFLSMPASTLDLARSIREVAPVLPARACALAPEGQKGPIRPRLLLVEDSTSTRALLRSWIERAGCEVVEASDGHEALERFLADRGNFQLVFTDLVMPRMDGLQLIRKLREKDPDLPVVVLTSLEDQESTKAALNLHVDEFLNKPFTNRQLVECLERQIEKLDHRQRARETRLTVRDVREAQQALVAKPEPEAPFFSVSRPLTDAGGDLFKWFRRPDGTLVFVLGDVMGHSVISSYAVAAFLGMVTTALGSAERLTDLADHLNRSVKHGPFPDTPICALLGTWDPTTGRVHLLNAGMPQGYLHQSSKARSLPLALQGTPLGFFDELLVEEKVLWLDPGDRLLLLSDGIPETKGADGSLFEEHALGMWENLGASPVREALEIFCWAAQSYGPRGIEDDVLAVAFEQGEIKDEALRLRLPSRMDAVDEAIAALGQVFEGRPKGVPLTRSRRFDIEVAAREAMTNAVTHGNAGRPGSEFFLRARWSVAPPRLEVVVVDEGLGYSTPEPPTADDPLSERGRGLQWIHHTGRAAMVGGELSMSFEWEA